LSRIISHDSTLQPFQEFMHVVGLHQRDF